MEKIRQAFEEESLNLTWVCEWKTWNSSRQEVARQVTSQARNLLFMFFDVKEIDYEELLLTDKLSILRATVTLCGYSIEDAKTSGRATKELAVELRKRTVFHQGLFARNNTTVVPYVSYSPDFVLADFLFSRLKISLF
jgi:hypothetical protein